MRTRQRIAALMRLPVRQRIDAMLLVPVALGIEIGLRTVSLKRLGGALGVRVNLDEQPTDARRATLKLAAREQERLDVARRILHRPPFNGTCLRRALLAGFVLRHRDHAVRIGVRKTDAGIAAHAWLEVDGVSLDPESRDVFAMLTRPVAQA